MSNHSIEFSSEYSRKEVEFLKLIHKKPERKENTSDMDEIWIVVIATPNVERGFAVRSQLQEGLGPEVKVIRIDTRTTIKSLRSAFDPDIILADALSIYTHEPKKESLQSKPGNGMALFFNKNHSSFTNWIRVNSHLRRIFDAWVELNDQ